MLACELVGTSLADALGLKTFDWAIVPATAENDYRLESGTIVPGPAFVTKESPGFPWDGSEQTLTQIQNPDDLSLLVLLDTWTLNCDRYYPKDGTTRCNKDNVWLEKSGKVPPILTAYDHTHCLSCGHHLTTKTQVIDRVQCEDIFGRFPEFNKFVTRDTVRAALLQLAAIREDRIKAIVDSIPRQWDVSVDVRNAITTFLVRRKEYISNSFLRKMFPQEEMRL